MAQCLGSSTITTLAQPRMRMASAGCAQSPAVFCGEPRRAPVGNRVLKSLQLLQSSRRLVLAQGGTVAASDAGWWTKELPENMTHVASVQELVDELSEGAKADQLVVVDFFAPWCGACRTLFPKLRQICSANPDVRFIAVNFEENKLMARGLGVKVLPYFQFYRGAEGRVDAFAASVSKVAKLRDAIEDYKSSRCFLEELPPALLPEFPTVLAAGDRAGSSEQPQLVA